MLLRDNVVGIGMGAAMSIHDGIEQSLRDVFGSARQSNGAAPRPLVELSLNESGFCQPESCTDRR